MNVLRIDDLDRTGIERVLDTAADLKAELAAAGVHADPPLERRTLAMLFEKPSTRTRVSFETGMTQLGGHAVFLSPEHTQLGRGEPIRDTARTLAGYVDAAVARLDDHADLEVLAAHADVPVVNGLTDRTHPCQTLADLLTVRETFGGFDGVRAAWVGDGNNVARSFALGCAMVGVELVVATPEGHDLGAATLDRAAELGGAVETTRDPAAAVADADVVYTDVWVSMGDEDGAEKRAAFEAGGFRVDRSLLAGTDARLMHCLPAHRGEEVTDDAIESDRSLVWTQAENRLHAQKGLLVELL